MRVLREGTEPPGWSMGNGWTDIQASGGEIEKPWKSRRLPLKSLNSQERNIIGHRNSIDSRTSVSHPLKSSLVLHLLVIIIYVPV